MSLLGKVTVLTLVMIALIIPAAAMSDDAAGEAELRDGSIWVSNGFDDRNSGTITVRVFNVGLESVSVNVTIKDSVTGHVYASSTGVNVPAPAGGADSAAVDVPLSFHMGSPGKVWVDVQIDGDYINTSQSIMVFEFEVRQSIWSNTWTYVAIILVIIIVGVAVFLKMRGAPKAEDTGTFTAIEEERKAGRKRSADKEEYKGRNKE